MDWIRDHKKQGIFDSIIDTAKLSPNSLCENHSPSTSFVADATDDLDEKLSIHYEMNDDNNNNNNTKTNVNNSFKNEISIYFYI